MVQRLEKGCHNLDHRVLQWESHFPAKKQQFHSNPRFNKSYFVHVRSIDDSWHECMILISELGANLRYAIYFEMRSELRTPPCWNAFSQCKMVWWLFERNSSLPNSGAACFCSFLPCLGYQEWEQRQLRQHRERQHRETSWTRNLLGWGLPWGQSSQCQNDRKYCTQYCQNNSFLLDGQEEEMLGKLRQSLILKLALARSRVGIFALREKHWEPISRGLPWQKKSLGFVATLEYSKEVIFQRYSNGGDLERFQLISLCQHQSQRVSGKKANWYKKNSLAVFNWTLENILMFLSFHALNNLPRISLSMEKVTLLSAFLSDVVGTDL